MNDLTSHQLSCMSHDKLAEYANYQKSRISDLEKELESCRTFIRKWISETTSCYENHSNGIFSNERKK